MEYLLQNKIALNGQIRETTNVLIFTNKKTTTQYFVENVREVWGERLHRSLLRDHSQLKRK